MKNFKIQAEGLIIRPLTGADYILWSETLRSLPQAKNEWDESAWKERFLTRSEFRKILTQEARDRAADRNYRFIVIDKMSNTWLGTVSLNDVRRGIFHNAYIGYRVFSPYWGQGIASRIVKIMTEFGFEKMKLHRIEAAISPRNKSSIKVALKNDYRKEGLSKRRLFYNEKWQDFLIYAKTSEEN